MTGGDSDLVIASNRTDVDAAMHAFLERDDGPDAHRLPDRRVQFTRACRPERSRVQQQ